MKIVGIEEALSRPGRDAQGRRKTWNHRIVRRYGPDDEPWLEITEVHYTDGKPDAFALDPNAPMATLEDGEDAALSSLRWTLEKMAKALREPILDERKDFSEGEPSQ